MILHRFCSNRIFAPYEALAYGEQKATVLSKYSCIELKCFEKCASYGTDKESMCVSTAHMRDTALVRELRKKVVGF